MSRILIIILPATFLLITEINAQQSDWRKKILSEYQDSIKYLTQRIFSESNNAQLYRRRASFKYRIKDFYGAREDYSKAIELVPRESDNFWARSYEPDDFYFRGIIEYELNEFNVAIFDFNQAITAAQEFLNDFGPPDKIFDVNQAIKLFPNYPTYYHSRGDAKAGLYDFRGAYMDYSTAIDMYNLEENYKHGLALGAAYYDRGVILIYNLDSKESGCWDLSKAGELGVNSAYDVIREKCN